MKKYIDLSIHEKISIKQYAITLYGYKWHTLKPNYISKLNELNIYTILSGNYFFNDMI